MHPVEQNEQMFFQDLRLKGKRLQNDFVIVCCYVVYSEMIHAKPFFKYRLLVMLCVNHIWVALCVTDEAAAFETHDTAHNI